MKKNIVLVGILVFVIVFVILIVVLKSTSDSCSSDCKGKCVDGKCIATPSCMPNCVNNMCKADGCGGICTSGCDGSCVGGECVKSHPGCTPDCSSSDSACKDDGCSGICGGCKGSCVGGKCVIPCTPNCSSPDSADKDDGCGGICGIFDSGTFEVYLRKSIDDTINNSAKDTKFLRSSDPFVYTTSFVGEYPNAIGSINITSGDLGYMYKNKNGTYKLVQPAQQTITPSLYIFDGIQLIQDGIYVSDPNHFTVKGVTYYNRLAIYIAGTKFTLRTDYP